MTNGEKFKMRKRERRLEKAKREIQVGSIKDPQFKIVTDFRRI